MSGSSSARMARTPAFVVRVDEGVQEADGDAFHRLGFQRGDQGADGGFVQGPQDGAGIVQTLRHRQAQMPRHQRLRQHDVEVILVVAALIAHGDDVAEPLGGDQGRARALALDHRVGGQRGAVDDQVDLVRLHAGRLQDGAHALHHALLRRMRGGQDLERRAPAGMLQREVGKGAANIDGEAR